MNTISNDQKQFLQAVATLAYGSGRNEKSAGGKGHMALMTDANGNMRIIKCNTHLSHAEDVQKQINSSEKARDLRKSLIDGSANLREKLSEIGRTLGMSEERLKDLLGANADGRTLLTRKVVAGFVNAAINQEKEGNADAKLGGIWTEAGKNAVKSDFSMTFEKVTAADATDFHGAIDRADVMQSAQSLRELNSALGFEGESPISQLAEKIERMNLLDPAEERQMTHLMGLSNPKELFLKDRVNQFAQHVFSCFGCEPTEQELQDILELRMTVLSEALAGDAVTVDGLSKKLDEAVKVAVQKVITPDRMAGAVNKIVIEAYGNGESVRNLGSDIVNDIKFQNGYAELLLNPSAESGRDFKDLALKCAKSVALAKAERDFHTAITNKKLPEEVKAFLAKNEPTDDDIKSFQALYTKLSAQYNKSMALNGKCVIPIAEIKNLISIRNEFSAQKIELKDAPEFFSTDILTKCIGLGKDLEGTGLERVGKKLTDLANNVAKSRSQDNILALNKFLLDLYRTGLCKNVEIVNHLGSPSQAKSDWQKPIEGLLNGLRNVSDFEKNDARKLLMKKLDEDVMKPVLCEGKGGAGELQKKVEEAVKGYAKSGKDGFSPLKEQAMGVMDRIDYFKNVLKMLSKGSSILSMEVKADRHAQLENVNDFAQYKCVDVQYGASYGNKYLEQSCLFHSVLKGLGVDVTRNNGLILRKALANYIGHCLDEAPKEKLAGLKGLKNPQVSDFVKLFNDQFKSSHDGCGLDTVPLDMNLKDGCLPNDFLSPDTAMDESAIPFLASMLKRPIVLEVAERSQGGYASFIRKICDVDIMTGKTINSPSSQSPITIMIADNHYQFLKPVANPTRKVATPPKPQTVTPPKQQAATQPKASQKIQPRTVVPAQQVAASEKSAELEKLASSAVGRTKGLALFADLESEMEIVRKIKDWKESVFPNRTSISKIYDTCLIRLTEKIKGVYEGKTFGAKDFDVLCDALKTRLTDELNSGSEDDGLRLIGSTLAKMRRHRMDQDELNMLAFSGLSRSSWDADVVGGNEVNIKHCARNALWHALNAYVQHAIEKA